MAWPAAAPVLTQTQSINAISEAEAGIAQCMADFLCNTILTEIGALTDVNEQVVLSKSIFCAYASKENGMAAVIQGLANKILADKGLVPGGDTSDNCDC